MMYRSRISWLAFAMRWLAVSVHGQLSGWMENQQNATMCLWDMFRIATLGDTVYIDGGQIYWIAGLTDGSVMEVSDDNRLGRIYKLNFSTPFNTSTNFSEILTHDPIATGPNGDAANNLAPNYYGGALLGNDHEFFTYGGLLRETSQSPPDADALVEYVASIYGADKPNYNTGIYYGELPEGITRYVTNGGAVSAPSENKAWYFGGYRSESFGPIYSAGPSENVTATNTSNYLITLDMATQTQETWDNTTLGQHTPSRADPSVVWVPVGEQGILVVLGGVTYPGYLNPNMISTNEAQSKKDSPGFMKNIDIYDVASKKWYQQPAEGSPPQLARGCAVVAPAEDYSSFNIYYYGGYDGLDDGGQFYDDVWILSLPSFMWMKVYSGTSEHGRAGHQCVMPYPDQMIVIGGRRANTGSGPPLCLDGENPGILQVYNLTENQWMDSYDPTSWNYYGVPQMIHAMIGGDASGGATVTAPGPSGWEDPELGKVFATAYPTSKLVTHYPYSSVGASNDSRGAYEGNGGGGTPSWLAPVLGVVLGLVFVTAVVVGIILYRRRKYLKKNDSEPSTDENGNRILSWVQSQSNGKAPTVTTDDTRTQYDELESRGITPARSPPRPEMGIVTEMPATCIVELPDTSPPVELAGDTYANLGMAPIIGMNEKSPLASNPQTPHIPYPISTPTSQTGLNSTHELSTGVSSAQPPSYTPQRPDSPPLGNNDARFDSIANAITTDVPTTMIPNASAPTNRKQVVSGVSGISDREISHLRQISGASTDSQLTTSAPPPPPASSHHIIESTAEASPAVSPPSVPGVDGTPEASDYVSVPQSTATLGTANSGSQSRQSVFHENKDDLNEGEKR
ncbi:hypothetical protein F5Y00DRAFT_92055 [Daldinia vernicosa]|uniref:uncharacterized protein n=1 Tax=Daldinia vernicosa TaxID=114800 RepID=UPI00200856B8|nr:uncharacterized protein F5Y00DRAFT_92055 [Daldinia vernicosa]KAI0848366.1 hypothetical protein F5Y00DRAFT_92055 [Daldinia vernicosa]